VRGGSWFCEEAKFDAAEISVAAARGEQNTRKTVELAPCFLRGSRLAAGEKYCIAKTSAIYQAKALQ